MLRLAESLPYFLDSKNLGVLWFFSVCSVVFFNDLLAITALTRFLRRRRHADAYTLVKTIAKERIKVSKQKRKLEWSFDFDSVGERISGFVSDLMGDEVELKSAELIAPLQGAAAASVALEFSVGKSRLGALDADSDNLFEARIKYLGEYDYQVSGDERRVITLRQKSNFPKGVARVLGGHRELSWDLALARGIPCHLNMKGGVGEASVDLSGLLLEGIKFETGVGKIALTTPVQAQPFKAVIKGGVGSSDVVIPAGSHGQLEIEGGVGEVCVSVAPAAAISLRAKAGMGKVDLPATMRRREGKDDWVGVSGLWETDAYDEADQRLVINFSGGIGSFQLKHFETL